MTQPNLLFAVQSRSFERTCRTSGLFRSQRFCRLSNSQFGGYSGGGFEGINTYFGGKMLTEKGVAVFTDRLGSVRANSNGESFSYFPWGEERGGTADNRTKFAGYYRDMRRPGFRNGTVLQREQRKFLECRPGWRQLGQQQSDEL